MLLWFIISFFVSANPWGLYFSKQFLSHLIGEYNDKILLQYSFAGAGCTVNISNRKLNIHLLKSTIETTEKIVKYVQS